MDLPCALCDELHGFRGVRQRQEVMQIDVCRAAPTKMIADPWGFHAAQHLLEAAQVILVQRLDAADAEGHAVLHDAVALEHGVEVVERLAAFDHEIFADDLEEVDGGTLFENGAVVRHA